MKKQRKKWKILPVILLVAVTVLTVRLFVDYFHETFTIQTVVVEGNVDVSEEKIIELSTIRPGQSLFQLSAPATETRIRNHWLIRDALVVRQIPDAIRIRVSERQPLLLMASGGRFVVLDKDGICIEVVRRISEVSLPFYSGRHLQETVVLGQKVIEQETLRVLAFTAQLPDEYRYLALEIEPGLRTWTVYTINGVEVRLGYPEELDLKFALLESILNETQLMENLSDVSYLDLSSPERPIVKYDS